MFIGTDPIDTGCRRHWCHLSPALGRNEPGSQATDLGLVFRQEGQTDPKTIRRRLRLGLKPTH